MKFYNDGKLVRDTKDLEEQLKGNMDIDKLNRVVITLLSWVDALTEKISILDLELTILEKELNEAKHG